MVNSSSSSIDSSNRLRIEGVLLHAHQPIKRALYDIRGIRDARASILLLRSRVNPYQVVGLLTNDEIKGLRTSLADLNFSTENILLRSVSLAKQRLFETRLIRGLRLRKGLTSRGQRTRNNNKTIKRAK